MKTAKEIYLEVAKKTMSSRIFELHKRGLVDDSIVLQAMELYAQQQVKKAVDLGSVVGQSEQFICYKEDIGNSRCSSQCVECGKNECSSK